MVCDLILNSFEEWPGIGWDSFDGNFGFAIIFVRIVKNKEIFFLTVWIRTKALPGTPKMQNNKTKARKGAEAMVSWHPSPSQMLNF